MSIEYLGNLDEPLQGKMKSSIFRGICESNNVEMVSKSEDELQLRWKEFEKRKDWQEDISIRISESEIYIVFYSGSLNMQDTFISNLNELLEKEQISCEIEEL